jgi:hypothetical protein
MSELKEKIKVYLDSGASLPKDLQDVCETYQFPYDSADRPKKRTPKVALSCELTWKEWNCSWAESNFIWNNSGHLVPKKIKMLIGKNNKADYKHLCSALRMDCKIFLTSDKGNIWAVHAEIETLYSLKIFHMPFEMSKLKNFIISMNLSR